MSDEAAWKTLSEYIPIDAFSNHLTNVRLDETHTKLLKDIMERLSQKRRTVIWLHDDTVDAPETKVTFSLVKKLKQQRRLGGLFICSSNPKCQSLNYIFPAIAYQLGIQEHHAQTSIMRDVRRDPALLSEKRSYADQIYPLFHKPVRNLKNIWKDHTQNRDVRPRMRVFVFDRMDNCCPFEEFASVVDFFELLVEILHWDDIPDFHLFFSSGPGFSLEKVQKIFTSPYVTGDVHTSDTVTGSHISLLSFNPRTESDTQPPPVSIRSRPVSSSRISHSLSSEPRRSQSACSSPAPPPRSSPVPSSPPASSSPSLAPEPQSSPSLLFSPPLLSQSQPSAEAPLSPSPPPPPLPHSAPECQPSAVASPSPLSSLQASESQLSAVTSSPPLSVSMPTHQLQPSAASSVPPPSSPFSMPSSAPEPQPSATQSPSLVYIPPPEPQAPPPPSLSASSSPAPFPPPLSVVDPTSEASSSLRSSLQPALHPQPSVMTSSLLSSSPQPVLQSSQRSSQPPPRPPPRPSIQSQSEDKWEKLANHIPLDAFGDTAQACLDGTRAKLLMDIMQHLDQRSQSVVWLHGAVGTGKTAVARSIMERLEAKDRLGGRFFFSRKDGGRQSFTSVLPTIAYQLGVGHHLAQKQVVNALANDPSLLNPERTYSDHILPLFIEPLRAIRASWDGNVAKASPRAFVFDGVDECCSPHEYSQVIHLFQSLLHAPCLDGMPSFHIFATCRADVSFQRVLAVLECDGSHFIDILSYDAEPDISYFMKSHLTEMALRYPASLPMAWPSEQEINLIMKRAAGQFIFAVTVSHFVAGPDAPRRLASVLRRDLSTGESAIHDLYRLILDQSESQSQHPCSYLAMICCLSQPMLPQQLERLMGTGNLIEQLQDFPSLVVVSRSQDVPIVARHSTLHDFFSNDSYSGAHHAGVQMSHGKLAYRCFVLMNSELKRDLFGFECPKDPARLNAQIHHFKETTDSLLNPSSALHYACMYWVDHLLLSKGLSKSATLTSLDQEAQAFFQNSFVYWIEAMAALDKLDLVLRMLRTASTAIEGWLWDEPKHSQVSQLLYDGERLVQEFRPVMSSSVMSLYHSALPFTPRDSALRQMFDRDVGHSQVRVQRGLMPKWIPLTLSIDVVTSLSSRHSSAKTDNLLAGVAVSSDGRHLASWHHDGGLHLWDTLTGSKIKPLPFTAPFSPTCRHKRSVHYENAITFSPDCTSVLLVSRREVWLCGIAGKSAELPVLLRFDGRNSGDGLCCTMRASGEKGPVIVVGTTSSILTWRQLTDQSWKPSAPYHNTDSSCTTAVSVSPCGQWVLSSACGDITVYLRQTETLATVRKLSIDFSAPPSSLLLCHFFLDDDHAVVIWSAQSDRWLLATSTTQSSQTFTGRLIRSSQLESSPPPTWPMFMSKPNLTQIPFGLMSVTPRLYFDGRPTVVQIKDQLFSCSGAHLTTCSSSKAMGNGSCVRVGTISDDKHRVHLWDPSIAADDPAYFYAEGAVPYFDVLAIHGERLVTAMRFCGTITNVTICDASHTSLYEKHPFPTETFTEITASHDLELFVCSSLSQSITLRSIRHGLHHILDAPRSLSPGEMGYMRSVSFSPDGKVIAGLFSSCVAVWCWSNRQVEQLGVVQGCFTAIAFSHDGSSICCLSDQQIRVQRFAVNGQKSRTAMLFPESGLSNFVCAAFASNDVDVVYTVEAVYRGSTIANIFRLSAYKHIISSGPRLKTRLNSTVVHCLSVTEVPSFTGTPVTGAHDYSFATVGLLATTALNLINATTSLATVAKFQSSSNTRAKGNFTFSPGRSLLVLHTGNYYYQTIPLFDSDEVDPFEHVPSGSTVDVESWSDFSLRSDGWIYKGSQTLCWVPPAYRPYTPDVENVGSRKSGGFRVLGKNKVVLVQQHDFIVLHFPHIE